MEGVEQVGGAAWRALENALPALADGKNAQFLFLPDESERGLEARHAVERARARDGAVGLGSHGNGRQVGSDRRGRAGLDQRKGHILALGQRPLKIEEKVDAVAHDVGFVSLRDRRGVRLGRARSAGKAGQAGEEGRHQAQACRGVLS